MPERAFPHYLLLSQLSLVVEQQWQWHLPYYTVRVDKIGHFKPCTTEIYLPI